MTAGKAASQAGHAFLDAYLTAPSDITAAYRADGGTKIVLTAADEVELRALAERARAAGIPCAEVIESNHIMLPAFDGSPILTAIGMGPVERCRAKPITGGLKLLG